MHESSQFTGGEDIFACETSVFDMPMSIVVDVVCVKIILLWRCKDIDRTRYFLDACLGRESIWSSTRHCERDSETEILCFSGRACRLFLWFFLGSFFFMMSTSDRKEKCERFFHETHKRMLFSDEPTFYKFWEQVG